MPRVTVRYFASLRDQASRDSEIVDFDGSLMALYQDLSIRHAFTLDFQQLRVAANGDFVSWDRLLQEGDEIVFVPPVSGG
jgi:molybdopterin synthase sulfur carrier subunit